MSLRALACTWAAAGLCACAGTPPVPPAQPAPANQAIQPPLPRSGELVGYFAAAARLAPAAQKKLVAQAADDWGRSPTAYARVKLGGLYAQPAPGLRDDARALSLLEPLAAAARREAGAAGESDLLDLAALLYAQVAERQRLARDEARKHEALRESNDAMKERLEAMKAIERSIQLREERQRTR